MVKMKTVRSANLSVDRQAVRPSDFHSVNPCNSVVLTKSFIYLIQDTHNRIQCGMYISCIVPVLTLHMSELAKIPKSDWCVTTKADPILLLNISHG